MREKDRQLRRRRQRRKKRLKQRDDDAAHFKGQREDASHRPKKSDPEPDPPPDATVP